MNSYDAPQFYRWKDPTLPPNAPALAVYFVQDAQVNEAVTRETGKQTYDNVLIIYVAPMGMPKSNVAYEVKRTLPDGTEKINQPVAYKYAEQIRLYEAGTTAEAAGTPLRDLIGMTPATNLTLKARGIHTIEMLAEIPDSGGGELMGFYELRDRARKYLEAREKEAPAKHLEAELKARDDEIASLKRQMNELAALVQQAPQPPPAPAPVPEPRRKAA